MIDLAPQGWAPGVDLALQGWGIRSRPGTPGMGTWRPDTLGMGTLGMAPWGRTHTADLMPWGWVREVELMPQ